MEIKKEEVIKRLEQAKEAEAIKTAELHQIKGIIADCNYWLELMSNENEKANKPKKELAK